MKSIQKSNVALSLMLLTSVASSFAMRSALEDYENQARSHRHQRRSPKTTPIHSDSEDLTQGRINGGDNLPATQEQQDELEQIINGNNNNSNASQIVDASNVPASRFAGIRAKFASFFGYFNPLSYSRPALFTKDGLRDAGTRYVVSPAKAVFMPFSSKQEIIDARVEAKKARFKETRFEETRIQNAAVKSTEFLNKHSYISNGVYYPALATTAYLSYKGARAAFKKACKWYNERQAEITLEDVLEKANRKVTGEITTSLAQAIQEDVNLSARINALSEAKRTAVNTVVEQLDRAYTLTNTQMKNQAISDVLTALTQVCQTA